MLAVPWPSINGSVHGDEVASLSLDAVDGALPALQNEHAEQDTSKLSEVQCARAVALVEAATYIPLEACYDLYHDSTHVTTQQSQGMRFQPSARWQAYVISLVRRHNNVDLSHSGPSTRNKAVAKQ